MAVVVLQVWTTWFTWGVQASHGRTAGSHSCKLREGWNHETISHELVGAQSRSPLRTTDEVVSKGGDVSKGPETAQVIPVILPEHFS